MSVRSKADETVVIVETLICPSQIVKIFGRIGGFCTELVRLSLVYHSF